MLPVAAELVKRIGWLISMRWLAVAGVVCTVELTRHLFPIKLPLTPLYLVVCSLALYNLILHALARRLPRSTGKPSRRPGWFARLVMPRTLWGLGQETEVLKFAMFAIVQIVIDLIFLAVLLHFSGGIENPFIYGFVFHIIIASILFSRRATYLQATVGLILIVTVTLCECFGILQHYPLNAAWRPDAYQDPALVVATLLVLGTTLYLSAYICSTIAVNLRERSREIVLLSKELSREKSALEQACERLSESERVKSWHMRKVSHELRGPLGTIQTALSVVLRGMTGEISERSYELIKRAEKRAGELTAITRDLLTLSQARESRVPERMTQLQPETLVTEAVDEARSQAEQGGVRLEIQAHPDTRAISMQADAMGLRQMVDNLLSNAIRYTPRGGTVTVRLYRSDESLGLEVEDTGIGVPEGDQPRIFNEFYRSKNAREHTPNGTGLGLAIVKAIVEQHAGTVELSSVENQGTRVTVSLPLRA